MISNRQIYNSVLTYIVQISLLMIPVSCAESAPQNTEIFHRLHTMSEQIYDGDGTWGQTAYGYRMALRDSYWRAHVYEAIPENQGQTSRIYQQRAQEVYQFLIRVQEEGASGVYGFPADVQNPEFGGRISQIGVECPQCIKNSWVVSLPGEQIAELYYDHGYALTAMARGYNKHQNIGMLNSIQAAADWSLDKPLTRNLNYLSALSKGLSYAFGATGNSDYIKRAIYLHQVGILPYLSPTDGSAMDAHNQQLEYHGFIVSGLIALKRFLPANNNFHQQLDNFLNLAVGHMRQRDLNEAANFGATWPGTNLLAWRELAELRPLSDGENQAKNRCINLIQSYKEDLEKQSGFPLQKALYSYFFIGLAE